MTPGNAREMFQTAEAHAIRTNEPLVREKILEQLRQPIVRLVLMATCLVGRRLAEKAIAHASKKASKLVGDMVRDDAGLQGAVEKEIRKIPRDAVNKELAHRVEYSIIAKMESFAESVIHQEALRVYRWGCLALLIVSHALHWMVS